MTAEFLLADMGIGYELYAMRGGGLPRIHDRLPVHVVHDRRKTAYIVGKRLVETHG